jgi:hypothetical protein
MSEFVKELLVLVDAFIAIRAEEEEIEREKMWARERWGCLASIWESLGFIGPMDGGFQRSGMNRWETVARRFREFFFRPMSVSVLWQC